MPHRIRPHIAWDLESELSRDVTPHLELIELEQGTVLCKVGKQSQYVYFPCTSVVSLGIQSDGAEVMALALIGREGMTTVDICIGTGISPFRIIVQASGAAMRMKSKKFTTEFHENAAFCKVVLAYAQSLTLQIAQTAFCNRFHRIESRLACWLLLARDRLHSDHFQMTHEMLSDMLGVRRVSVTKSAHALKSRGLIDYRRGEIDIIDGVRLRAAACSCYYVLDTKFAPFASVKGIPTKD